jgi:hypothetical protein
VTKFLALSSLIVAGVFLQLADYWYAFGLWPKSWTAFALCSVGYMVLIGLRMAVDKEGK